MISTITNRGRMAFMVFTSRFTSDVRIEFLKRLIRQHKRKIFLIVDGHPVHRSRKIASWLRQHEEHIAMFRLPACSPDLNPDELLNQDIKSNYLGRRRPHDRKEMIGDLRSYIRGTQRQPHIVANYFKHPSVAYAE